MRVKLRDKLLLGDNISKFVRKASNPENLKFMLGVTNTHRKQSSVTMSPLQQKQNSKEFRLSKRSTEKTNSRISYEKLERMLQIAKTPLSSRLLAEEEKDVRQLSERERVVRGPHFEKELEVYGRAKFRKTNWRQERKDQQYESHRQKIKQFFKGSPQKNQGQGLKDQSKTTLVFFKPHIKPWETIRLNGLAVQLPAEKRRKKQRNTSSLFYKTMYG